MMKISPRIETRTFLLLVCCAIALIQCSGEEKANSSPESVPPGTPPRPLEVPLSTPWHTYHGNAGLTGASAIHLPEKLALRWRFKANAAVYATPVSDGKNLYFANAKGQLFAVDLAGEKLWSRTFTMDVGEGIPPREEVFDAPLICFEDTLVAASADGMIYALHAATGETRWATTLDASILGSVNYQAGNPEAAPPVNARLYVIDQGTGELHCLDFKTGTPLWKTDGIDRCDGSPGIGAGKVVFGSCAAALHVFSAGDGSLLREIAIDDDSQVAGGVAMIGDSVYSGSRSGKVIHANAKTGVTAWTNQVCEYEVFTTPAVNDARVVIGASDGGFYALDRKTGKQQWAFMTEGDPLSPVIAGDKVVAVSDGTIYLMRLEDGKKLWAFEVSDTITSPAIVGNLVVVGSEDGSVAAFGTQNEREGG